MPTKTPARSPKAAARSRGSKPAARPAAKAPARRKAAAPAPAAVATGSKQSQLIALLRSAPGATLPQMTELTGWQPHTVRGTISGVLRKKLGLSVACEASESGVRVYRIVGA
ncbi:DUF3489 domain-containing protein [Methylibium petroleiphilum]|uniref:DUF3489 domain-containing protein n=1 Tax=Methylibium petroleiphilum TaxID=105560 RepID=UPI003D2AAAAF